MSNRHICSAYVLLAVFAAACGNDDAAPLGDPDSRAVAAEHYGGAVGHDDGDHAEEGEGLEGAPGTVHLSAAQVETMGIAYGSPRPIKVNDFLRASGTLGLPPNAYAAVSARAAGYLRDTRKYVEGDYVSAGTVVAYLENAEFIEHQRAYLEAVARLAFLEEELARQVALADAEAGVLRDVQSLRSEVAAKVANVAGLRKRLEYLGIDAEGLRPDNIAERIPITASRGGYVTELNFREGLYVEPATEVLQLIDVEHIHVELAVFERDIARVSEGQHVTYRVPALDGARYEARVEVIGKDFDADNKTVRVHAHPVGVHPPFLRDLFVEARIWLDTTSTPALPDEAIFRDGEVAYVYAGPEREGDEVGFRRLRVATGASEEGYTAVQLIDTLPADLQIVTEGAYYVYAQSQAGALEHDH